MVLHYLSCYDVNVNSIFPLVGARPFVIFRGLFTQHLLLVSIYQLNQNHHLPPVNTLADCTWQVSITTGTTRK